MMQRSWWSRVWTIQEAGLAPQAGGRNPSAPVIVQCGSEEMPFELLSSGLHDFAMMHSSMFKKFPLNNIVFLDSIEVRQWARHWIEQGRSLDLMLTMHRVRSCGWFDPRDRIYGLYGIFKESRISLAAPDLSKTKQVLY
jgi:hypothetical protein